VQRTPKKPAVVRPPLSPSAPPSLSLTTAPPTFQVKSSQVSHSRMYSSEVEQLTFNQIVLGSNPNTSAPAKPGPRINTYAPRLPIHSKANRPHKISTVEAKRTMPPFVGIRYNAERSLTSQRKDYAKKSIKKTL
jgi:hypothetical protein